MTKPLPKLVSKPAFLRRVLELVHTPYIYGGRSRDGVDCWGIVALAWEMAGGGERFFEWWTDVGWQKLEVVGETVGPGILPPETGDLAF
jgi:hypothetical protein